MAHRIVLFTVLALIVALCLFVNVKIPQSRIRKGVLDAAVIVGLFFTAIEVLEFDLKSWLSLLPDSPIVVPMTTSEDTPVSPATLPGGGQATPNDGTPSFQPRLPNGVPLYHRMLDKPDDSPEWKAADDGSGAAGYDGWGYYVASRVGGVDRAMVSMDGEYRHFALEVFATPLSDASSTAVLIKFDADTGGVGGYYFVVAPDGICGLGSAAGGNLDILDSRKICPPLEAGHNYRMRLEVVSGELRVFIDDKPIKAYALPSYDGGYIGLGVHNFAPDGNLTEAKVRFSNLTVWPLQE